MSRLVWILPGQKFPKTHFRVMWLIWPCSSRIWFKPASLQTNVIWATAQQNQQNDLCAQWRLRSVRASTQSDQSLLSQWRNLGSLISHWVHSEDADQTAWMCRLIWVFTGRTCYFVAFVILCLLSSLNILTTGVYFFLHTWKVHFYVSETVSISSLNKVSLRIGPGHVKMCLMPYANNKNADQPAHPHSLISTFIVPCLDIMICILAISKVSRF